MGTRNSSKIAFSLTSFEIQKEPSVAEVKMGEIAGWRENGEDLRIHNLERKETDVLHKSLYKERIEILQYGGVIQICIHIDVLPE